MDSKNWQRVFSFVLVIGMLLGFVAPAGAQPSLGVAQKPPLLSADKVEDLVISEIEANGHTSFFVWMSTKADLSGSADLNTKIAKGQYVFDNLRATAEQTQKDLRGFLDNVGVSYRPYYIVNAILVRGGDLDLVMGIASRSDVSAITANHKFQLEEPFINPEAAGPTSPSTIESNISFVRAPEVWAMGYTGQGTVVAGNDTGLDEAHPAIAPHYRGCLNPPTCSSWDHNYNWWDATGTYPNDPWDGFGHGTHTTGTMVGDDGGDNQIGMAPGAQTIHCKNMDDGGGGDDSTFLECFEWDLAPWDLSGSNPDPAMAPDAVNNSWGYWGGGDNVFRDAINTLQAAGIAVEVSAGNEGPGCQTLRSPGDYQEVLTTGSIQHAGGVLPGTITDFSSRGPSSLDGNYFPDVMAPGENIRSSVPGGGYEGGWSGTSMAGPHVTALVGLIWSACPAMQGMVDDTFQLIKDTAVPLTGQGGSSCGGDYTTGPNNDWGMGTIDAEAAVQMAIGLCAGGTLQGTVTDSGSGLPLEGTAIRAEWDGGNEWHTLTDDAGFYSIEVPTGTYTVTASLWAYGTEQVTGVEIEEDQITVQDFELDPMISHLLYGYVTDVNTGWPLYASLNISGYPYGTIWTDPVTGYYEVELPEGAVYNITASAWSPGYLDTTLAVGPLTGDAQQDFQLDVDAASCNAPGYGYSTPTPLLTENFETGYAGWTMTGLWNPENQADTCGSMVAPFPSPTNAAYYGIDGVCTFDTGSQTYGDLTMVSSVALPAGYAIWLQASSYSATECGGDCFYDVRSMQVSTDGINFTEIGRVNFEYSWGQQTFDISSYAGQNVYLRFRFDSVDSIANNYFGWMLDDVTLLQTECLPSPGGLVVGNVYDENTGAGLVGADVNNDEGGYFSTAETPDDPAVDDGFYLIFTSPGDHLFTASYPKYVDDSATVTVVDGENVSQDLYLGAGMLSVDPLSMHVTVDWGDSTTQPLNLANDGTADAFFEIAEKDRGWMPALHIPAFEGTLPESTEPASNGRAPNQGVADRSEAPYGGVINGVMAYANDAYPTGDFVSFDTDIPGSFNIIANLFPGASDFLAGADFLNGDFSMLYAIPYYGNQLITVDTTTGVMTTIGPSIPGGGESWSGLTSGPDGSLYGAATTCAASTLYSIDPDTGAVSTIGAISNAPCIIDIAMNSAGEMYGIDIVNDNFLSIDPTTGAGTIIGPTGVAANYAQGMDFDEENGILYWAAYSASGELRIIDPTTGGSVLVGPFQGGDEIDGFATATGGGGADVPWLSEDVISGTIPADDSLMVNVTMDSMYVDQPGDYYATLNINNDTPYGTLPVPVTMTVVPADDMGKLTGMVWDNCTEEPLEEVEVLVDGGTPVTMTLTDENGEYTAWLVEGTYPVSFSLDGYWVYDTDVTIVAGETLVLDVALIPSKACMVAEPDMFEVWVLTDTAVYTHYTGLDISNIGGEDLTFKILEREGGYAPGALYKAADPLPAVANPGSSSVLETPAVLGTAQFEALVPDAWTAATPYPMGIVRYAKVQCADDTNSFYIIGGVSDGFIVADMNRYDADTDTWTSLAPFPAPDEGLGGVCYDGKIYASTGGYYSTGWYIYDIAADSWSQGANTPRGATSAAFAAWDGLVYLIGGDDDFYPYNGVFDAVNIYDIASDTWIGTGASMPTGVSNMGFVQLGAYVYIAGGWNALMPSNSNATQRYDIEADTWEVGPTYTGAKADMPMAGTSQYLYTMGGDSDGGGYWDSSNSVLRYDFTAWPGGAWEDTSDPLPQTLQAHNGGFTTGSVVGGEVWSVGGLNGATFIWTNANLWREAEPPFSGGAIDVPWIWEDPITGTIPAQSMENIGIYFTSLYTDGTPMPLGTYTATLRVSSNAGTENIAVTMHVVEEYIPPTAEFTATSPVCDGEEVAFDNVSDPGIPPDQTTYLWAFGDGITSTLEEPGSHIYAATGTYTVTLEACNIAGCDEYSMPVVVNPYPEASFTFTADLLEVTFTNTSLYGDSFLWDFGDGTTSTEMSPIHVYADAGTYLVTLTVYNECGVAIYEAEVSVIKAYYYMLPLQYKAVPLP